MNRFVLPTRVYLEDTDAQSVVYNASYFRFMERARTDYLRSCGIDHEDLRAHYGVNLVLSRVDARFIAPARLGDMLNVTAEITSLRGARMIFRQTVERAADRGDLLCEATAEVACMDIAAGRPKRFPTELIGEWQ